MSSMVSTVQDAAALRAGCQQRLQDLMGRSARIAFACLGTVDGRTFAFERRHAHPDGQRMSAFTSSLLALCEAFTRDAIQSRCLYNVMSAERGVIVTVRVPCRSALFALSIGTDGSETVAMALRHALDAADAIAAVLDSQAQVAETKPALV